MTSTNKDIAILTDTEAETSMEMDASMKIEAKHDQTTHNATKSVFNITLDNCFEDDEEHTSVQYRNYEEHLKEELKTWLLVYRNAVANLKKNKEKHPIVDKSILSAANRDYLEKAPNLQNFLRESLEFRNIANNYLNVYEEVYDMQSNVLELAKYHLGTMKAIKEAEMLAKV